jgi:hypothetical protein
MPRRKPLPDLSGVDLAELQLTILAVLDQHHCGPEFRKLMHAQLGACLEQAGGAQRVLAEAIAAIKHNGSK